MSVLDRLFGVALGRAPLFAGGLGDRALIARLLQSFHAPLDPPEITVRWLGRPRTRRGLTVYQGMFASPLPSEGLPREALPSAIHRAFFELVTPAGVEIEVDLPVCLYLAATTEQGFASRRRLAAPLVRQGVAALILENPYYGWRRPRDQTFVAIPTVADQLLMNTVTILEARALLGWLSSHGYTHLGVTGYSMGGFMAAYVASLVPGPVAAVPVAAGASAVSSMTRTEFSRAIAWEALCEKEGLKGPGHARRVLAELFDQIALDRMAGPVDPDCAVIVAGRHDAIVPPREAARLASHWGAPVRWLDAAHINGIWRGADDWREALLDAFGVLLHKHPEL